MRFSLMIEPQQGLTYAEQLAIARSVEAGGWEGLFRSDHFQSFPGPTGQRTTDAWSVVAGLARETERIHLGVLVSPVTFRLPGVLAKVVATVDEMSGGRIELGLGAGWHDEEHAQLGIPFPEIGERAGMLEEQLAIIHGLYEGPDGWSFAGDHYVLDDSLFRPKPGSDGPAGTGPGGRPRIIVGGDGSPRSMRIAARFADEFNLTGTGPEHAREKFDRLDDACRAAGRDPASLARSAMVGVLVGRDPAELDRRTEPLLELVGASGKEDAWFVPRRARWVYGTIEEARATIERWADAGAERLMLQDLLPRDPEMIELLGRELVGSV